MNTSKTTLEEEIIERASQEIAREMDKSIFEDLMTNVLIKEGWTETTINPAFGKGSIVTEIDWYAETAEWIHINAKDDYKLLKGQWLFKDPKDAMWFILRWSS